MIVYYVRCIIRLLSTAQGSLLDDEKLVNTLQSSKATAHDVQNQLEVNQKTEKEIDTAREVTNTYVHVHVLIHVCRDIVHVLKELPFYSL